MTAASEVGSLFGAVRRAGLLDPISLTGLAAATTMWGPSIAAGYSAAAARQPNRLAVVDDHGSLTYRNLERRASRVAGGLKAAGIERGTTIGILCRNHRGFVEANLAASKLGVRPILVNPGLPPSQLSEVLAQEAIDAVMADRDLVDSLASSPQVFAVAPEEDERWSFPDLEQGRPLRQLPHPLNVSNPVILTSGSTGVPRGARRSVDPRAVVSALGFVEAVPYRRGDVVVLPAPLFHGWGFSQMVLSSVLANTIVLRRTFDPRIVLDDLEAHGASVLAAVPVMLHRLLESDAQETSVDTAGSERSAPGINYDRERDLSGLRLVATSGSTLPGDLATRWMDRFGDTLYNVYGSTEVGQATVATPQHLRLAPETAGCALRGVEVKVVDHDDQEVPVGTVGEILIGSAAQFDAYTDGGRTRTIGHLMSTGDRGHIDAAGRLCIDGRADDMIVSGGENLFPATIERCLLTNDEVREAIVVGVVDADLGHKVRAIIVTDKATAKSAASTTKTLRAGLRANLASHEIPREFVYVSDLPRNSTGKVLRSELRGPRTSVPNQYRPQTTSKRHASDPQTPAGRARS